MPNGRRLPWPKAFDTDDPLGGMADQVAILAKMLARRGFSAFGPEHETT